MTKEMYSKVVCVKKTEAKNFLRTQINNRKVRQSHVIALVSVMNAGDWQCNGESLKLSSTGKLLDGQHRLHAFVLSNLDVLQTMVIYNVPDDAFFTLDRGERRSASDVLSIEGYKNTSVLASGIKALIQLEKYNSLHPSGGRRFVSSIDIAAKIEENPEFYCQTAETVHSCYKKGGRLISQSVGFAMYALFHKKAPATADYVIRTLMTGAGLEDGDILFSLRRYISNAKLKRMKLYSMSLCILISRAWNAICIRGRKGRIKFEIEESEIPVLRTPILKTIAELL